VCGINKKIELIRRERRLGAFEDARPRGALRRGALVQGEKSIVSREIIKRVNPVAQMPAPPRSFARPCSIWPQPAPPRTLVVQPLMPAASEPSTPTPADEREPVERGLSAHDADLPPLDDTPPPPDTHAQPWLMVFPRSLRRATLFVRHDLIPLAQPFPRRLPLAASPTRRQRVVYGIFALGWRGSARHWHRYETMYLLLAGLATPLVLSVHTVVSFDFAISIIPGWHTTIFPPYFVAGAIYSGFAMVLMLAIPIHKIYGLEDFITDRHLNNSAMVMLATGLIVAYGYGIEAFMGWYSGNRYDTFTLWNRLHGPYAPCYYALLACNIFIPQLLWIRKLRTSPLALFLLSAVILSGMWLERFIIVVVSLHRDFLTSSWGMYYPTRWDWMTFIGTIGLFVAAMFLFVRILPMISIFEMRTLLPEAEVKE